MGYELGFVGAGNMAEALAKAALAKNVLTAGQMVAADPSAQRRRVFESLGIATAGENAAVLTQSAQVLLAVKPQALGQLASDLARLDAQRQVVITIMAGVSSAKLESIIGGAARIVRVMPNTPLQVGYGMAGLALGAHAMPGDEALAVRLLSGAGRVVMVSEAQMDAVTAVSGSGPAYVFYLAEAMERAAGELGLGKEARLLVVQTLLGAAHLLDACGQSPSELRRQVTSPGGTTEAAIGHLDSERVSQAIVEALKAAARRSRELA